MRNRITAVGMLAMLIAMAVVPAARAEEPAEEAPVRQIKMYAENWRWTPSEIRVPVGTTLQIQFESRDASHSFVLKAFKVKVPLPQDKTASVEFVVDKPGKFTWRCGRPCGDGCAKMTGTLIVEE